MDTDLLLFPQHYAAFSSVFFSNANY